MSLKHFKYYPQKLGVHSLATVAAAALLYLALANTPLHPLGDWTASAGIALLISTVLIFGGSGYLTAQAERRRHSRGVELVSPKKYQARLKADGISVPVKVTHPFTGKSHLAPLLPIPKSAEREHICCTGDTGSGKSSLFMYYLQQIAARPQERAIVFDPKGEFWERFGNKARGDIFLYPFAPDCPAWDLRAELSRPELIPNIAKGLLPKKGESDDSFFVRTPRAVLAALLRHLRDQPEATIEDLIQWTASEDYIQSILQGTYLQNVLMKGADSQRGGILASLSDLGDILSKLPSPEGRASFSFAEWAANPNSGWIFLGAAGGADQLLLKDIFNIFLDLAGYQLMDSLKSNRQPTWIFLDELATLGHLTSLETLCSQARGYDVRLVYCMQNKAQIEEIYGGWAAAILSAAKTKVFLTTREPVTAEWCASAIGKPEHLQRVPSESSQITSRPRDSITYRTERKIEHLVLPSEIMVLPPLTGYFLHAGYTVRFEFDYIPMPVINPIKRTGHHLKAA